MNTRTTMNMCPLIYTHNIAAVFNNKNDIIKNNIKYILKDVGDIMKVSFALPPSSLPCICMPLYQYRGQIVCEIKKENKWFFFQLFCLIMLKFILSCSLTSAAFAAAASRLHIYVLALCFCSSPTYQHNIRVP